MLFFVRQVAEYQGSLGVIQDGSANITALFPNELVSPASNAELLQAVHFLYGLQLLQVLHFLQTLQFNCTAGCRLQVVLQVVLHVVSQAVLQA
jgi:hypothetical protein